MKRSSRKSFQTLLQYYLKQHISEIEQSSLAGCNTKSLIKQLPFLLGLPNHEDKGTMICHGLLLCENKDIGRQPSFGEIFYLHLLPKNEGKWFFQNVHSTSLPNYTHGIRFKETVKHTLATLTISNS
jgi:hypothetical protein